MKAITSKDDNSAASNEMTSVKAASKTAVSLSFAATLLSLALLASLHILSPEFDPAWRMVSEYANGHYGWVLSLMFVSWAVSSWTLAFAIWSQVRTVAGKIGLVFLVAAGLGEAMASVFDINNSLHELAGFIGIGSLPIAAMLISVSLSRTPFWSAARKALLWTANLTWISVVLLIASLAFMIIQFSQVYGGQLPQQAPAALPAGVMGLVGWANRFLVIAYCAWVMTVARQAIKVQHQGL